MKQIHVLREKVNNLSLWHVDAFEEYHRYNQLSDISCIFFLALYSHVLSTKIDQGDWSSAHIHRVHRNKL